MQADGFITAGGNSLRMGRDKAWLELDGVTMIEFGKAFRRVENATLVAEAQQQGISIMSKPTISVIG